MIPNGAGGFTLRPKTAGGDSAAAFAEPSASASVPAAAKKRAQKEAKNKAPEVKKTISDAAAVTAAVARERAAVLRAAAEAAEKEAEEAAAAAAEAAAPKLHEDASSTKRPARLGPKPAVAGDLGGKVANADSISAAWSPLGITAPIVLANLALLGYASPTTVQRAAIPEALLSFRDVVSAAATGSGKTAAYALPIICRLIERRERAGMAANGGWAKLAALVVVPTRELAVQVRDHFSALAKGSDVRAIAVVGGLAPEKQDRQLRARPDVVVATPGRLEDVVKSGHHSDFLGHLARLQFLVLDEADRLVEKGSFPALRSILSAVRTGPKSTAKNGDDGEALSGLDKEAEAVIEAKKAAAMAKRRKADTSGAPRSVNFAVLGDAAEDEVEDDEDAHSDGDAGVSVADSVRRSGAKGSIDPALVIEPPAHFRRQTFLFSATLGISTAADAKNSAMALIAAENDDGVPLKKKALRKALAATAGLTPVESLMRMVGVSGKPALVRVSKFGAAASAAAGNGSANAIDENVGSFDVAAAKGQKASSAAPPKTPVTTESVSEEAAWELLSAPSAPLVKQVAQSADPDAAPAGSVAMPPGLRLARVTIPAGTEAHKEAALYSFLLRFPGRSLVFVNSIGALRRLSLALAALRVPAGALHAQMAQRARLSALEAFRASPTGVLVATDVAARGLDIPSVDHVIQFALPARAETFLHRCGRTARAAAGGLALALVAPSDDAAYQRICRVLGMPSGLAEFPSDTRSARTIAARVALARAIADLQISLDAASASQGWLVKTAKDMDIAIDDATSREAGGLGEVLEARRRGKKDRGDMVDEDDEDARGMSTLDESEQAAAAAEARSRRVELSKLKSQLRQLLGDSSSILPSGTSRHFVTSNPELGQAPHPLQARIRIEADDAGSTPRVGLFSTKSGALVAPRVSLSGAGGASSSGAAPAIAALSLSGRHVHVPGVRNAAKRAVLESRKRGRK
jgi:ATP-dependent RNA helicase DDX24/MAK5